MIKEIRKHKLYILVFLFLFNCNVIVYSAEDKKVDISCSIGENVVQLPIKMNDEHVWVNALTLSGYLGFTENHGDNAIVLRNAHTGKLIRFFVNSTKVESLILCEVVEYKAPFPSMVEDNIPWIPLEFSLLMLDSNLLISDNQIFISMPQKNIINSLIPLGRTCSKYNFSWEKDIGYNSMEETIIGASSVTVNLLNDLLKDPMSYVSKVTKQFMNAPGSYDYKYAKEMSLLLITESQSEMKATANGIKDIYNYILPKGKCAKILEEIGEECDGNVGHWSKICSEFMSEMDDQNTTGIAYNSAYNQLEKALSKQSAFENTGGLINSIQNSIPNEIAGAMSFTNKVAKATEFLVYANEFNQQDKFAVEALESFCRKTKPDGVISASMIDAMKQQAQSMRSNMADYMVGNYIASHWKEWVLKIVGEASGASFGDLLATDAKALTLAWDIASDYIPIIKDGLDSTAKFELALYAMRVQAQAFSEVVSFKYEIVDNGSIDEKHLYELAQKYYIYLKACIISRDAAVASLASKKYILGEDVIREVEKYENNINLEIAEYLAIMKRAQVDEKGNLDNGNMAFGFLQSDNEEYLKEYSDQKLMELLNGDDSNKNWFNHEKNIFEQLPETFDFSSGAGAWGTEIVLQSDGTFSGKYSDSNMGDVGDGYPNGTVFICEFSGKFTEPERVGEYVYSMHLKQIEMEHSPGEEYFEDGVKYVCSEPYGLDDAEELLIYLPGCPLSEVAEEFLKWSFLNTEARYTIPSGYFGIYNVNGEKGFVGLKEGCIWRRAYKYSYGGNKSELEPSYYGKSHLTFWTKQGGAAAIHLYFDWTEDGQQEVEANGTGDCQVQINFNEDNTSATVIVNSRDGWNFSQWGGTEDGKLVAEYVFEEK